MSEPTAYSLPPEALRFLDWLKKTDGRDKLYRLVAYGSKIPIHYLKTHGGDKDTIQRLSKGASAVGLSRKLMRMFRSVQFLQDFLSALNIKDPVEKALGLFKSYSLFIWMVVDHMQWFHKVGYIKLADEKKWSTIHSKAWFFGLLSGAILSAYKLKSLLEKGKKDPAKEFKLKQGIVKNSVDLIVPTARLGWMDISDGTVGLAGTITSLIGIYDTYPTKK